MSAYTQIYKKYMKRCLTLAKKAAGKTSPNPMVGAVILDKNLNFVSEGYHQKCGEAHAEVNAINAAKEKNIDIKGGIIIVNLEPCSHYGKTPPCADLIIKSGLKKVVVGCTDPNEKVAGNGIKKCQNAGLEVITGILEEECKKLNEIFFKNQLEKLPFITIKTATTIDGKIATKTGSSKWITGEKSRNFVQKLRNNYDAILTSSQTVIADDPSLTCRMKNGKNPIRIIVDSKLTTPASAKVYNNDGTRVIIATTLKDNKKYPTNVEILTVKKSNDKVDLKDLTQKLYDLGINSVLVEAGGKLNGALLKEKLADKLIHFTAPKLLADTTAKSFAEGFDIENIKFIIVRPLALQSDNASLETIKILASIFTAPYYCCVRYWSGLLFCAILMIS